MHLMDWFGLLLVTHLAAGGLGYYVKHRGVSNLLKDLKDKLDGEEKKVPPVVVAPPGTPSVPVESAQKPVV